MKRLFIYKTLVILAIAAFCFLVSSCLGYQNSGSSSDPGLKEIEGYTPYHMTNGYGTTTYGGLEGQVIRVTNLNKEGLNSLKSAIQTSGPRLIVFEVGGVIDMEMSSISISSPYVTIAGQTAPPPGITLIKGSISINTHDVVIQHIAVRPGDAEQPPLSGWEPDAISTYGTSSKPVYNVVIDHVSTTWGIDENLSISGPRDLLVTSDPDITSHDVTFYKCIIAEGLSNASHSKGEHSKGTLLHDSVYNISIIGCLYAHNNDRNPRFKGGSRGVVVNCVMYNYGHSNLRMQKFGNEIDLIPSEASVIGNVCIKGSDADNNYFAYSSEEAKAYFNDNIAKNRSGQNLTIAGITISAVPLHMPAGLTFISSNEALYNVLKTAGMRAKERDPIDRRIIESVINGTGEIIDSQNEVGGYPNYSPTSRSLSNIPDNLTERCFWLDSLSKELEVDLSLDMSPLYSLVTP